MKTQTWMRVISAIQYLLGFGLLAFYIFNMLDQSYNVFAVISLVSFIFSAKLSLHAQILDNQEKIDEIDIQIIKKSRDA